MPSFYCALSALGALFASEAEQSRCASLGCDLILALPAVQAIAEASVTFAIVGELAPRVAY
jgi:hypothetical protein